MLAWASHLPGAFLCGVCTFFLCLHGLPQDTPALSYSPKPAGLQPTPPKSHIRLNTRQRPYKCQLCDQSFNDNVILKNHIPCYHTATPGQKNGSAGGALANGTEWLWTRRSRRRRRKTWSKRRSSGRRKIWLRHWPSWKKRKKSNSKNSSKTNNKSGYLKQWTKNTELMIYSETA